MKTINLLWLLFLPIFWCPAQTNGPLISSVAVLTIHVSNTNVHAGVFHLLADVLKLPVDYYPVSLGQRRYAAVYAGNLFIEPCGPYSGWDYPVKDFQALFFGLNCVSTLSVETLTARARDGGFQSESAGQTTIRITDRSVAEGIYLAITSQPECASAESKELRLQTALTGNRNKGIGLERVREIWLGYDDPHAIQKWTQLLGKPAAGAETEWLLNKQQRIRLVKSPIGGVRGIVCKVGSLGQAERYLKENALFGRHNNDRIELDPAKTFGLRICLSAD